MWSIYRPGLLIIALMLFSALQTPSLLAMVILAEGRDSFISQTLSVMELRTRSLTVEALLWGNTSVTMVKMLVSFVKVSTGTCQEQRLNKL